jgi:predicted PurR-regulated permease PerM
MNETTPTSTPGRKPSYADLARQALIFWGVGLGLVALAASVAYVSGVLLVAFAAVLFAVFLRAIADLLTRYVRVPERWSVPATVLLFLATGLTLILLAAPQIASQATKLRESLPQSLDNLQTQLDRTDWGRFLTSTSPNVKSMLTGGTDLIGRMTGMVSGTLQGLGLVVLVFFIGMYFALNPALYTEGLLKLVPPQQRQAGRELLAEIGEQLKWWLVGRLIAMLLIGVPSSLGLWLLGVDLAFVLGTLAGLLNFIPNFGPIIALVPAVLMGSLQSPMTAVWVFVIFVGAQIFETYIFTPLLQQRLVALTPALVIATQLVMAVLFGGVGLALAVPLTVVALAFIRRLYVQDALGDPEPGQVT